MATSFIKMQFLLFICFSFSLAQLSWQTTHNGTSTGNCNLTSSKLSITLHPCYADVIEEAEISAVGSVWSGDSKTLEIVGTFQLSEGSAVRSMLLWNGNNILKAKLLSRADANSNYEDVVDRDKPKPVVRDPAIIEYLGNNQYRFKIYPVEISNSRKIRILYTVPLHVSHESPQFQIYTAFTYGTMQTPNSVETEIYRCDSTLENCIINHGGIRSTINFGATYSLPITDFVQTTTTNPYGYYQTTSTRRPIHIYPVSKQRSDAYCTSIPTGDKKGYYAAIFTSIPDTIFRILRKNDIDSSSVFMEATISTGTKIYASAVPEKKFFDAYIKSITPWDSSVNWTCYNSEGLEICKYKQIMLSSSDSVTNSMIPFLWGAKYTLSEGSGSLGALFGFVDNKMSLLALESDTLCASLKTIYQVSGVPQLFDNEIIIDPAHKPAAPDNSAIFEYSTDVKSIKLTRLNFNVSYLNGILKIQFSNQFNGNYKCNILDAQGRVVYKFSGTNNSSSIVNLSLPKFLKGMFVIQIQSGKESFNKKLIIK